MAHRLCAPGCRSWFSPYLRLRVVLREDHDSTNTDNCPKTLEFPSTDEYLSLPIPLVIINSLFSPLVLGLLADLVSPFLNARGRSAAGWRSPFSQHP